MTAPHETTSNQAPLDHAAVRSIVFGILLAMFLAALDQTIVATALPTIGRELADVENLSWVVTAYLLTATTVTPLYGKLSDIHGRRTMLLTGISIFAAGSIASALSSSMLALILARALQGLGGGGLISLAQTIIADVVPPRERGRFQGLIGLVFGTSSIGGPMLGGFFAEHLHWSMIFWVNLPVGFAALMMTNNALKRLPRHERPHQLDVIGAGLMMSATIALLLALTWGGIHYPWTSVPIVALLIGSGMLWILFVIRLMTAKEPFLPLSVLLNPVVGIGTTAVSCVFGTMIGLTIFVPLFFEAVLGLSASASGLALIPLMGGTVVGSTLTGQLMVRVRHYKRMAIVGLLPAITALLVLAVQPHELGVIGVGIVLGIVGVGIGTLFPITTVSVQNAVLPHQLGTATASMNFFRSLTGALAVSGFSAIILGGVHTTGHSGLILEILNSANTGLRAELTGAFRWMFLSGAASLSVGFLCLCAMEERPLLGHPIQAKAPVAAE